MKCKNCNTENLSTAKFCNNCGEKIELQGKTCPNPDCKRSDLPDEAELCPDCGTKYDQTEPSTELDSSVEHSNSETKDNEINQGNELEVLPPLSELKSFEIAKRRSSRMPVIGIIGIGVGILVILFVIVQFVIGQKYDSYVKLSENAINTGDCNNAITYYNKANDLLDYLLIKNKVSLDNEINECHYKTAFNRGEELFSDLSLNISDVKEAKDVFEEAQGFKNTDIVASRILFCEKLITAMEAYAAEEWVSALDYYNDALTYGMDIDVDDQIISEIKDEKTKIITPKAKIIDVTKESNVYRDGDKGMFIHVKFETTFMKNCQGRVTAWFYYENGEKLMDENDRYCTKNGHVSCGRDFNPSYKESEFKDFELFIPYPELHLSSGSTDLKFKVGVLYDHEELATSDYVSFTMTHK